ncbi:cyclic pyranopterin monophosphate synthase MoaC [Ilyobacter polytropus]|uniref:Cyclic pyranopterin monophosphate synthase n=1 Tax=Ilyobacter polytropus (strain ATCC 51220 / DSM 2926 / LMG 16218 / CuHBu1) TaxID=572544 RepID=E3H9H2_ILYPC|nr:cyclic pyranopterin monophosphate synthase MoaC [Ilyobacter polytropus]ADO83081.1 GTP cyclohydrolase subunit MoaC [Ilyobacter polytropus DSM 2926]
MNLTHFNDKGRARMVDVGDKSQTDRVAVARGYILMAEKTIETVKNGGIKKGDVLSVAQVGGIMGAKKTWDLIPMCHNILIDGADINFTVDSDRIWVEAKVRTTGKTGIEMEALTAVSVACLSIYDMCKAIDKKMIIGDIKLIRKTGGKSDFSLGE